jgi:DNA-binding transcriptional MerR regulator
MIRYHEQRGVVRGAQARDGHRRYTDDDVRRLRRLRALLAANIAPECAERALDADLPDRERRQVRRALELLIAEAQEAHARLDADAPGYDADDKPPEQRISLMFDTRWRPPGTSASANVSRRTARSSSWPTCSSTRPPDDGAGPRLCPRRARTPCRIGWSPSARRRSPSGRRWPG